MSLINTEVKAFNATAYQNGEFIECNIDQVPILFTRRLFC